MRREEGFFLPFFVAYAKKRHIKYECVRHSLRILFLLSKSYNIHGDGAPRRKTNELIHPTPEKCSSTPFSRIPLADFGLLFCFFSGTGFPNCTF
jgi:hypothetical protein